MDNKYLGVNFIFGHDAEDVTLFGRNVLGVNFIFGHDAAIFVITTRTVG